MSTKDYDFVILGGGTGGYVAAIRAAQLGKTVAVVEKDKLGGTCLHRGCIPTKAYLRSAEVFHTMQNSHIYGVTAADPSLDFGQVRNRKQNIVDKLHQGVQYLMQKNKIDVYNAKGRVIGPSIFSPRSGAIALDTEDEDTPTLLPKHLIIATGSSPSKVSGLEADGEKIINSDQALEMDQLPRSIIIIGGGAIGVEWASMLTDFGVEVTLVESMPRLIAQEEENISEELERSLSSKGVRVLTSASVKPETFEQTNEGISIEVELQEGQSTRLEAEKVLTSVGRRPNTDGLGLENTDISTVDGKIKVNAYLQTNESHIYAIGDVIGGYQLAHVAAREGILAVEHAAGLKVIPLKQEQVPRCIYTRPEVAAIGWTEKQAKDQGRDVKTALVPFKAIGKAWIHGDTEGFVKVVADKNTQDILGVHMIGPQVTDAISEAALAQILDATPWEVGQTLHPHPTLTEVMSEVMLAVDGKAIGI